MKDSLRLGIMQPYFFPYLEYFRLIASCDMWISFDTVKFNRKSWMNRNRIINCDLGWSYINVPVSRTKGENTIATAPINEESDWRGVLFDKLRVYEFTAPHYVETKGLLKSMLDYKFPTLSELNTYTIRRLCEWLLIDTRIERLKEMNLDLPDSCPPGQWALRIAQAVGADSYLNASGGAEIFDPNLYRSEGVSLSFHKHINLAYDTGPFDFVPDLSIIDAMMWIGRDKLREIVHGD